MEQGLSITAMGMTVVFVVLIVIYFGIVLLNLTEKFFPPPAPISREKTAKKVDAAVSAASDEEIAAMKAALSHHLDMKPDRFDLEIK